MFVIWVGGGACSRTAQGFAHLHLCWQEVHHAAVGTLPHPVNAVVGGRATVAVRWGGPSLCQKHRRFASDVDVNNNTTRHCVVSRGHDITYLVRMFG